MLLFMGSASHAPTLITSKEISFTPVFWVLAIIIGVIEANAIFGKPGPMASVKGVITSGFVLTVILYGAIGILV